MHQAPYLLTMLLTMLAGRGLAPETLDPWRAWVVFKQYARVVDEVPDPGVSVQLVPGTIDGTVTLEFIRQVVMLDDDWLEPVGGVVTSFTFADDSDGPDHELWSFEHRSFERFVDAVEQTPEIAELLVRRPLSSRVQWEDA